jgi:hypothetical protein
MSLIGTKLKLANLVLMSAFDPNRTLTVSAQEAVVRYLLHELTDTCQFGIAPPTRPQINV